MKKKIATESGNSFVLLCWSKDATKAKRKARIASYFFVGQKTQQRRNATKAKRNKGEKFLTTHR